MRKYFKLQVTGLLGALAAFLCLCSLGGFLGMLGWLLELMSHFRAQYAIGLAVLGAAFCLMRRVRPAALSFFFAAVNLSLIVPLYFSANRSSDPLPQARLKFLQLNVSTSNSRIDLVRDFIGRNQPDVIVLEEVDESWIKGLQPIISSYQHAITLPREDNFGIAIYSKLPLLRSRVLYLGGSQVPSLLVQIRLARQTITVVGTHSLPPVGRVNAEYRNGQLEALADLFGDHTGPSVILGDLNTTPWSPYFHKLLRDGNLTDTARGFGFHPSWPARAFLFQIPIDHCLVSKGVRVVSRKVGTDVGSDHLPILLDLAFSAPEGRLPEPAQLPRPRRF